MSFPQFIVGVETKASSAHAKTNARPNNSRPNKHQSQAPLPECRRRSRASGAIPFDSGRILDACLTGVADLARLAAAGHEDVPRAEGAPVDGVLDGGDHDPQPHGEPLRHDHPRQPDHLCGGGYGGGGGGGGGTRSGCWASKTNKAHAPACASFAVIHAYFLPSFA